MAFERGYVYLRWRVIGRPTGGGVYWVHQDPVAKSKRVTNSSGKRSEHGGAGSLGWKTNRSSNEAFQPRKFTTYERDAIVRTRQCSVVTIAGGNRFDQPDPYDGSYN